MTSWEGKQVLLISGAGFLGSHIVEQLAQTGLNHDQLYSTKSKVLDIRTWENCVKAVKGRDIVIHLAAEVGGHWFQPEVSC